MGGRRLRPGPGERGVSDLTRSGEIKRGSPIGHVPPAGLALPPIIVDLMGQGLDKAFTTRVVAFDLDGTGPIEQLLWLSPAFAFLAIDRDGDGKIGSGLEISFTQDKAGAETDLEGLAAFDSNGDGALTPGDARFGEFRLWQDVNSDGLSQAAEIRTLTQAGIAAISLAPAPTGQSLATTAGNVILNEASFTRADGSRGSIGDAVLLAIDSEVTAPGALSGNVEAGGPAFVDRPFGRSSKRYLLSADNGMLTILPVKTKGTLDPRAGQVAPATILTFRNRQIGMLSPLILDLDGDGIELRSIKQSNARFDMDGDGAADDTGWVGKGDGILVIDRDGDGLIRGPSELSFLGEKAGASSDLDGLSALDSNRDGKIDGADKRFAELKVWTDTNRNGTTDAGELRTLADLSIASIGLGSAANREKAKIGSNMVLSTGVFTRTDGSTGTLADAALAFRPTSAGEKLLQSLRAGLGGPLGLGAGDPVMPAKLLDFEFTGGTPQEPGAAPPLDAYQDGRTALIAQHMASFGVRGGEAEASLRDAANQPHFDYFA